MQELKITDILNEYVSDAIILKVALVQHEQYEEYELCKAIKDELDSMNEEYAQIIANLGYSKKNAKQLITNILKQIDTDEYID